MKFTTVTAVSALALLMSLPAFAADVIVNDKTGTVVVASDTGSASGEIKAYLLGDDKSDKLEAVLIQNKLTAHGMIGEAIINTKGEKIADLKDIIIGKGGRAILVVVSDHGVLGIGKKVAAFDYDKVVAQAADGKVVMTLSQDMVDHAADFSYDQQDWAKAKVIPTGSVSTNELLKGDVLDNEGKKLAGIENIFFRGAEASQIIVSFNKTLGMGGDLAALTYDDLQMVRDDKELDFKLTANQTAGFKGFKKSVAN